MDKEPLAQTPVPATLASVARSLPEAPIKLVAKPKANPVPQVPQKQPAAPNMTDQVIIPAKTAVNKSLLPLKHPFGGPAFCNPEFCRTYWNSFQPQRNSLGQPNQAPNPQHASSPGMFSNFPAPEVHAETETVQASEPAPKVKQELVAAPIRRHSFSSCSLISWSSIWI